MRILGSLLFTILFFIWSAIISIGGLPCLLLHYRATYVLGKTWTAVTLFLLRWLCGVKAEYRGLENLPDGPAIIASKHQSAWETLVLPHLTPKLYPAYVLKVELTRIPLFGRLLKGSGMIAVDRAAGAKALKAMLTEAKQRAAEGRSIVIYPEGTRTEPGKKLPYHPGVAAIYRETGLPIVPIALNSGLFWARNAWLKNPGTIVLEVLPPIPPGLDRHAVMDRLEREIEEASARLAAEAEDRRRR